MRIISGRFKGRRLVAFKASHIRPTTDRVKESIFNKIQSEVAGARVLDLFSGTGSLGLEAVSRDANEVVFVDDSSKSMSILKKNVTALEINSGIKIEKMDVFKFLKSYNGPPFDFVFIDPPFKMMWADRVLQAVSDSKVLSQNTWVAIESVKAESVNAQYGDWCEFDRKNYGDKQLHWFEKKRE